jgi:LysM repeat protein
MSSFLMRCAGVLLVASMLLFPTGALAAPAGSGETVHIVQWGETMSMIAERYGVTLEAILAANGLHDPDFVYVGQRLVIPVSYDHGGSDRGAWMPGSPGGNCDYYTVQLGDTLTGIAYRYDTTANALMQANNLASDFIYERQKLCVPARGEAMSPSMDPGHAASGYYTVRAGDTLAAIARRFGVSQTSIVQANNLSNPSLIYVGQSLIIPGARSDDGPSMPSNPMNGPPGQAPMGPDGRPPVPDGQMGPMDGGQMGPDMSPAPPPGYSSMGSRDGYSPQAAAMEPSPAAPPDYAPPGSAEQGATKAVPMWTGSQIAHSQDPDEITTLLVLVEEGRTDLDVMIRSSDGFVARGVTGVYYEFSWLPSFAFRGIPGGDYEVWIEGEASKVIKASVDPGWRATVDLHWKIVSPDPVVSSDGWIAEVVDNTSGSEPIGAFSILVVRTGAIGNKIRVTAPGGFEAVCITGTKPEHGPGACDMGGLNAGTYQVILDGTHAAVEVYLDGVGTATVEFRPAAGHEYARWDP